MPEFLNHEVPFWLEWVKTAVEIGVGVTLIIALFKHAREWGVRIGAKLGDRLSFISTAWTIRRMNRLRERVADREKGRDVRHLVVMVATQLGTMLICAAAGVMALEWLADVGAPFALLAIWKMFSIQRRIREYFDIDAMNSADRTRWNALGARLDTQSQPR